MQLQKPFLSNDSEAIGYSIELLGFQFMRVDHVPSTQLMGLATSLLQLILRNGNRKHPTQEKHLTLWTHLIHGRKYSQHQVLVRTSVWSNSSPVVSWAWSFLVHCLSQEFNRVYTCQGLCCLVWNWLGGFGILVLIIVLNIVLIITICYPHRLLHVGCPQFTDWHLDEHSLLGICTPVKA